MKNLQLLQQEDKFVQANLRSLFKILLFKERSSITFPCCALEKKKEKIRISLKQVDFIFNFFQNTKKIRLF